MADGTIVLNQTLYGNVVQNVTVWNNIREPEPDAQELADAIRLSFANSWADRAVNNWSLNSITIIYNDALPIWSQEVPFTLGPLTGAVSTSEAANQVACLASTIHDGPPPNRGRIYLAGAGSGQIENSGLWNVVTTTAARTLVEGWMNGITTSTNQFFLRIGRRDALGTLIQSTQVTAVIARGRPATQRRRRLGVGV